MADEPCTQCAAFLAALKIKGKRFIWRTIVGTLLLSLWLYILPLVDLTDGDYVLAAILAAVSAVSEWALYCLQNQRPVEQRWSRR